MAGSPRPLAQTGEDLHELDDSGLLERIATGDRTAFWVFWCRHYTDLFWTYHRLCKGNRQEIHDCLSGLCINLSEVLPLYARSIIKTRTWLRRTAINHFIDRHRAHQRHPVLVGSLVEIASIADGYSGRDAMDPERTNADRALLVKVLASLDGIRDERMRQAARMRFIEEQPYADIAAELSISEELARKWIQQIRSYLRSAVPDHRDLLAKPPPDTPQTRRPTKHGVLTRTRPPKPDSKTMKTAL